MKYVSTNDAAHRVSLKEAVLCSLPPDNGLYMPERIPVLGAGFWDEWRTLTFQEIGCRVALAFFGEDMPEDSLRAIVNDALSFDAPLVAVAERQYVLELFHGPTLAFKDFGARFMARIMGWLARDNDQTLTVLVATSGDTGGAVAHAFHDVPGIRVVILYPRGKVSGLQEKQLTTLGGNITALEVDGTFDDCQRLVKAALLDSGLSDTLQLTSANSINISRLVPQSFYYIHAARQLPAGVFRGFPIPRRRVRSGAPRHRQEIQGAAVAPGQAVLGGRHDRRPPNLRQKAYSAAGPQAQSGLDPAPAGGQTDGIHGRGNPAVWLFGHGQTLVVGGIFRTRP